jgi:hypothetical protein
MIGTMAKYTLDFLLEYSDEALLAELRRVAELCGDGPLTKKRFEELSASVSGDTIRKRFSSWRSALEKAGIPQMYVGQPVTERMREQPGKGLSAQQVLDEILRIHALLGKPDALSSREFKLHSKFEVGTVRRRFGTWRKALNAAGIGFYRTPRKYTDEECYENLAMVWEHFGRSPHYREMFRPPSTIQAKTYVLRWGTWRKAKKAFFDWAGTEGTGTSELRVEAAEQVSVAPLARAKLLNADCREVRPALRFKVFLRDKFRCLACGRSPATHPNVHLHADHIKSVADSGKTLFENLQTLCQDCNLGKGKNSTEPIGTPAKEHSEL